MSAHVCTGGRPHFASEDVGGGSEAERAAAFSSYFAYCGRYEVKGDIVVHSVTMSSFPNWVGSEQTRYFDVADEELVLRTPPTEIGGRLLVNELRWRREE